MSSKFKDLTRDQVLAAIAEHDRHGKAVFLATHGFGDSRRYKLVHEGREYPSKAILGVAAGLTAREFSGGAAHACKVLRRLGFEIRDLKVGKAGGAVAVVAATLSIAAPGIAQAEMPVEPVAVFSSGCQRGEVTGFANLAIDVGVTATRMNDAIEAELHDLAGTDVQVFVDSGAFSEVSRSYPFEVVKPLDEAHWDRVLALYERLAFTLGDQLHVVAPDRVGCQVTTLVRLKLYGRRLRAIEDAGARVLVPVQRGELDQVEFWRLALEVTGLRYAVPAMPCKKAATSAEEVGAFVAATRPVTVHLLGMGRSPRARKYLRAIAAASPTTQVQLDSCMIVAHAGRTKGPRGGARRVTLASDLAKIVAGAGDIPDTVAARKELTMMLAFRSVAPRPGRPDAVPSYAKSSDQLDLFA